MSIGGRGRRASSSSARYSLMMKLWRNLLVGVVVSTVFLWIALRDVNWFEFQAVLQNARWEFVPIVIVVWSAVLFARAVRWHFLMDSRVRLWQVFHVNNIGFLINNTLPFRVGELVRAYLISREYPDVSAWTVLSTILTERILDVLAIVVILILVLPALPLEAGVITTGLLVGSVALVAFATVLASARNPGPLFSVVNFALRFVPLLRRVHPEKLVERVLDGLKPLTTRRGLLQIGTWTIIAWILAVFEVWALALLFPDWPQTFTSYAGLALAVVGASLSIVIPFTPAGVGPFEVAVIFALGAALLPPGLAATYAVIWHTGLVLFYVLWGVIGLIILGVSPRQVWYDSAMIGDQKVPES